MVAKKKTKKKPTKFKTAAKRRRPATKIRKKLTKKKASPKKKPAAKKPSLKKAGVKAKTRSKKKTSANRRNQPLDAEVFAPDRSRLRSAGQSGDLQGLSNTERADSESVDELLEEGNAFEADVVAGVENAGNADEQEVRTHEVPEDDVPEEYLDEE